MTPAFSTLHGEKCLLQSKVKVASILTVIKFELRFIIISKGKFKD